MLTKKQKRNNIMILIFMYINRACGMAFILTCSVFYMLYIFFTPIGLADFYAILTAAPFFFTVILM